MWLTAAALFLELHAVDGSVIQVKPDAIVSMRGRHRGVAFTEGANCLLNLSDGKYLAVREDCIQVFNKMEESR